MKNPRIEIAQTTTDRMLDVIGALGIIVMIALVIAYFGQLPDTIPGHFDYKGKVNGMSGKSVVLVLPAVAVVTFIGLTIGVRFPHLFNYPLPITEQNAERQYKNSALMIRILKTLCVFVFLYLTYATIQNAMGELQGLGVWFTPVALVLVFGTIALFMYRGFKLR